MKPSLIPSLTALFLATFLFSGCAAHRPQADSAAKDPALTPGQIGSSVDISYVLGHVHRRFLARATGEACVAQTFHDQQILKETVIDQSHYSAFFDRVIQFISAPPRTPAGSSTANPTALSEAEPCRSPFTVTVKNGAETKIIRGCRATDEGALSHLVRDGEFLLYSKK